MALLTFDQAIKESDHFSTRHVLLGNGFSIACRPHIFQYEKLFEQADFSKLSPTAKLAFDALNTNDFERVIKTLRDTKAILEAYGDSSTELLDTLQRDADGLRELLVQTIAHNHPAWPGEIEEQEYAACRAFIANFNTVYTFNYDLLLYWAQSLAVIDWILWHHVGQRKALRHRFGRCHITRRRHVASVKSRAMIILQLGTFSARQTVFSIEFVSSLIMSCLQQHFPVEPFRNINRCVALTGM